MAGRRSVVMNHHVTLFVFSSLFVSVCGINHFLDTFETLNYRPLSISRTKRSIDGTLRPMKLKFRSHNRTFHLHLEPIEEGFDVFADDFYVDEDGRDVNQHVKPHRFLFNGYVRDDPHSTVYGSILDGIFDGHVHLGDGTSYTIDKVSRYFDLDKRPKNYHSVIYADDAINHAKIRMKRSAEQTDSSHAPEDQHGCGLNSRIRRDMEQIQNSGESNLYASMSQLPDPQHSYRDQYFEEFSSRYSNDSRSKRSLSVPVDMIDNRPIHRVRTCSIYMQADQKLYEHILHKEGNGNPVRTREEIVSLFYNHIKAVNLIYESTDFRGIRGLNFVIQRTSIFTPDSCHRGRPTPGSDNPFCEENVDVSNYLNMNSQRNHSAFCLAYALTFRDFVGGKLGLAWVASPNHNTAGGICQIYQRYNEGSRGWVFRSLNTGIVTLVNYGNRVPTRVSQLTLAHEIGHNFGSPHDFPLECQPGLPDGNYIMFASATSGDKPNNAKFSKCSVQNISMVLSEVLHNVPVDPQKQLYSNIMGKRNCFQERTSAFCGNQIKEPGEECDCGFSDKDCEQMEDSCCIPHEINGQYRMSRDACKRRSTAQCSPSEGQCCNASRCSFFSLDDNKLCREESECLEEQYCSGKSPVCPESRAKRDGLACQDATKVCHAGACNGSVCAFVGLKDCFLTEGKPEQLCHLACEKDGKCVSSFLLPEFDKNAHFVQEGRAGQSGLLLHPGSPCNNYKGYCDIFRKCRSVDSNGPLARLKNLLFNKHTIKTVSQWVQEHWWAVILMGIGVIIVMALFVKCCAVHTPSTNPNKMPALNFYDTLRHPQTLMHRRRHTRAAASNVQNPPQGGSSNPPSRANNGGGAAARHHRNRRTSANRPSSSSGANAVRQNQRSEPSAPPLIPAGSIPAPPVGPVPPIPVVPPPVAVPLPPPTPTSAPNVIVVEPPPPYTAHADPASQLGGPKRGHRKNRRRPVDSEKPKPSSSNNNNRRGAK